MPARSALLAVTLGALSLAGCAASTGDAAPAPAGATVALDGSVNGRAVRLAVGQRVTVTLDSNPTTGYGWALADSAGGTLTRDGEPVYTQAPADPGMVGVGGEQVWTFRAVRAGAGTLRLEYGRSFEPDAEPVETFSAPVEVR
ncbi:MAG TPA: protease inhibitor I42 family protein [Rubricoccaceae bacterium]|jgi:inhibitor of cysteine peptidase